MSITDNVTPICIRRLARVSKTVMRFNKLAICNCLLSAVLCSVVVPSVVAAATPESKEEVQVGESFAVQGDWENAIVHFKQAVQQDATNVIAHYDLGVAYARLGELDKARDAELAAIKVDPRYILAYTQLGAILVKLNDLDGAEKALKKAVEIDPNDDTAKEGLAALIRLRKEKNTPQFKEVRTASASKSNDDGGIVVLRDVEHHQETEAMLEAATRHYQRGELAIAKKLLKEVISRDDSLAMAQSTLGLILFAEGNHKAALARQKKAIELDWSNAAGYFNYGWMLAKMGEWKKAAVAYAQAYNLDPARVDAKSQEAVAKFNLGQTEEAEHSLQMLSSKFPGLICVRLALATIYQAERKNELAKMQIMLALQTDPHHVESHQQLASLYLSGNQYREAIGEFQWVLSNNPASNDSYVGLAEAQSRSGDIRRAIYTMRKAVEVAPKNADSLALLSSLLMNDGENGEAIQKAQMAIKLDSEQSLAKQVLAACCNARE